MTALACPFVRIQNSRVFLRSKFVAVLMKFQLFSGKQNDSHKSPYKVKACIISPSGIRRGSNNP